MEQDELALNRLRRAREALAEAHLLADAAHHNASVSRLYYACFYAVNAYLGRRGLSATKHTDVRSLFNRELVRSGLVVPELGDLYRDLFEARREADYDDFPDFTAERIGKWLVLAEQFIDCLQDIIGSPNARAADS